MSVLAHFAAIDRALVAKGFPATSPWWREQLERFYRAGRRQLVLRVGRRGGKSSTLCRIAVVEALYGEHTIPPGDVGIVGIVSVSRDEAASRLRTIRAILDALGVSYREREQSIELTSRPIVFRVFSATVAGVVGGTWICALCDEVARWRDADSGANPATEVLASLRPTLATMPQAKLYLSSSPLGTEDAHATAFAAGDDEFQRVAFAPTWIANPNLTEAETHALERDAKMWAREYAARPQAGAVGAFDADAIDRAIRPLDGLELRSEPLIVIDSSAGSGDAWTWAAVAWCSPPETNPDAAFVWAEVDDPAHRGPILFSSEHGRAMRQARDANGEPLVREGYAPPKPVVCVWSLGALVGRFRDELTSDDAVDAVDAVARRVGARRIVGDPYQGFFLTGALANRRLHYVQNAWTSDTKARAVLTVRRWLSDGTIVIEPGAEAEALRRELLSFQEKIAPSGVLTYGARRGGHDDRVALLLNAAMAESAGLIGGSPVRRSRGVTEIEAFDDFGRLPEWTGAGYGVAT